jgi:hypothetical protein
MEVVNTRAKRTYFGVAMIRGQEGSVIGGELVQSEGS